MKRLILVAAICAAVSCAPRDGLHTLHVLTTNDVHGAWFDSTYVGGGCVTSLMAVNTAVDSIRAEYGAENVLLIDAGDILQGDNAPYYYNYVATGEEHLYPRIAEYMGYDVIVMGNHDVETGHPVYDRIHRQLRGSRIPLLAGNAIDVSSGKPYFPSYAVLKKAGLRVLVLGYTNANIKAWLQEDLWKGMDFESLVPLVQNDVDRISARVKPHAVIVAMHSGTGEGDGTVLESQGLDLFNSLTGVDVVVCAHDHSQTVINRNGRCLVNAGTKARYLGNCTVEVEVKNGKVVSRCSEASLDRIDPLMSDPAMHEAFRNEFEAVRSFTLQEVGTLGTDLLTRDAYAGMCDYINLIHTVQIGVPEAVISFAAPLTYNRRIAAGTLLFNDMFTIYPFENQMFVVNLTGREIKDYLEFSYDTWIQTSDEHVLRIVRRDDERNLQAGWSFVGRSYNFDSAAGLVYTVDVTKPSGERLCIKSLADGTPFSEDAVYPVAMTSYRASGGGGLMPRGAGISADDLADRIVAKYPEIRELIYRYILEHENITSELVSDESLIGEWHFVPESAAERIQKDMDLLFRR